jgi:indolepyruvate ferredoxin oxidoreductase alpha subunit
VTFAHERLKVESRMPAAQAFIRDNKLNEVMSGDCDEIGIIVMGGLTNGLLRALERIGLAVPRGCRSRAQCGLSPGPRSCACAGKRAVLVVEEGHPVTSSRRSAEVMFLDGLAAFPRAGTAVWRRPH